MSFKRVGRVLVLGVLTVGVPAVTGVASAGAQASGNPLMAGAAEAPGHSLLNCIRFDSDDPLVCGVLRVGPKGKTGSRGPRGSRGARGAQGVPGPIGPTGVVGPMGPIGLQGPKGNTGDTGPQGITGQSAAPGGTIVVPGKQVTYPYPSNGQPGGHVITAVATCPQGTNGLGQQTPQAYGGGVTVQPTENESDEVATLQTYPGRFNGSTVDPVPNTGTPEPANAFEGQAVVISLSSNDTVDVQAYVICGPGTTGP